MTLNYNAHGKQIEAAYKNVTDSVDGDRWVIFDYEGNSNTIRVGEEGTGGLDDFATSFSSGKLQFGVIAVRLSSDVIPKIVLVHWQGEGVPTLRLASTTQHAEEFKRFLKSVHILLHARSEIDVEPDVIRKEVRKLPAANTTAHVESTYSLPDKIESVYKPTKPHVELSSSARDQFWNKMNDEEKRRIQEEKTTREAQQKQYEEDRKRTAAVIQSQAENYQPEKVTSVYKPVKPHVELKTSAREEFWNKMNEEEKRRVEEEKASREAQQKQYEEDRKRTAAEIHSQAENYQPDKVSSVYKPVKPHVELKTSAREEFWNKMNEEEKTRQAEEKRANEERQRQFDEDRKRTTNDIHEQMQKNEQNVEEKKPAVVISGGLVGSRKEMFNTKNESIPVPQKPVSPSNGTKKWPPVETKSYQEVKEIVNRVPDEPQAVVQSPPAAALPLPTHVPPTFNDVYEEPPSEPEPEPQPTPSFNSVPTPNPPTYVPSQYSSQYDTPPSVPEPEEVPVQKKRNEVPAHIASQYDMPPPILEDDNTYSHITSKPAAPIIDQYDFPPAIEESLKAMALWDYQAADDTEISFDPDDIITDIDQVDSGWWKGKGPDGRIGLFPANYVKLM